MFLCFFPQVFSKSKIMILERERERDHLLLIKVYIRLFQNQTDLHQVDTPINVWKPNFLIKRHKWSFRDILAYLIPKSMCSWIPNPKHPVSLKFLHSNSYSFTFKLLSKSCIAFSPLTVTRLSYSQHHSYSNLYHHPHFLLAAHLHYSVNFLLLGMALLHLMAFHKGFGVWFQSQHSNWDLLFN